MGGNSSVDRISLWETEINYHMGFSHSTVGDLKGGGCESVREWIGRERSASCAELTLASEVSVGDLWVGERGAMISCQGNRSCVVRIANWPTKFEKVTERRVWVGC